MTSDQATADQTPGRPGRVLVVDDIGVNRFMLALQVRQLGHVALQAEGGAQALEVLRTEPVDLVLLDVFMPAPWDGYAVLAAIKDDEHWREIPVIMVSAVDEFENVVRCIECGAEDYLTKPPNGVLLRARVAACLEKKRLRDEERRKAAELEAALERLEQTQDQLVSQQKLASLGALTAGVAHELKNPLNFVVNFARLSLDAVEELREALGRNCERVPEPYRADAAEVIETIAGNAGRIAQHGQRADSIIRGMLLHSREGSGDRQTVELNAFVAEYVQFAYQGLRASSPGLHVHIREEYDPRVGRLSVSPQDLSRVIINVVQNGCQAVQEKRRSAGDGYTPTLLVRTRAEGECIEVRVRDNGPGVPESARERVFQPFFTTKPAGAGTGLGLSISYEIVRRHGGELRLESVEGEYAEFIIELPAA